MQRLFPLLFCLALPFFLSTQLAAQSTFKKVNIRVVDAVTGKPVEGAEITFKALIGKAVKKTDAEGKAVFDMFLMSKSLNMNYTVKYPNASKSYKTYNGSISLIDSKDSYEYTAPIQPDVRTLSFKISDDKRQPLSNATVKLKDGQGNEITAQTDANGIALFEMAPGTNLGNASLDISKPGFNNYTLPIDVNDQTNQVAVVAPLVEKQASQPQVIIVDGTTEIPKPKKELPGATNNVTPTSLPPGYFPVPKNPDPLWGPYQPACDANPLASVPLFTPLAVEDEKTLLDNISSACIGAAGDAVNALVEMTESITSVNSKLHAIWSQAFQSRNTATVITAAQKSYDDTKKVADEDVPKMKAAVEGGIEKAKELFEKMKELAEGPEMYAIKCMWDGMKDYAIPEPLLKLKKSTDAYGKAKTAMQEKLEAIDKRLKSGEKLKYADKELFTDWKDVKENIEKTTSGLSLIYSYVSDPKKILPYETQANLALSNAEKMIPTLTGDCQIREVDRQLKQGINAAQTTLAAARKYAAQMKKGESKWRQIINDYVYKNFKPEDRGWEYFGPSDFRRELLPQGAYGSWVNYHNEAIAADKDAARLEELLIKLSEQCSKIQPIAVTLNERVNKYENMYNQGLLAVENCKLDEARNIMKELEKIEKSPCGHFFPKPYGKTKSEELDSKIKAATQMGKCKAEGAYVLKQVIPLDRTGNEYFRISATEYAYLKNKGEAEVVFTLNSQPPAAINLRQQFYLDMSARCTEKNPVLDYSNIIRWQSKVDEFGNAGGGGLDFVIVGNYGGKLIPSDSKSIRVITPADFTGERLVLVIEISSGQGSSVDGWVKYVYEKATK